MSANALQPPSPTAPFSFRALVWFVTLLATALAMAGAFAHALELPNKMTMDAEAYLSAQQIYRGWDRLAVLLAVELAGLITLLVIHRREPAVAWRVGLALLAMLGAQAVFWAFTFPANQATDNWTFLPDDWRALRDQWEWSHFAGWLFQLTALGLLFLRPRRRAQY